MRATAGRVAAALLPVFACGLPTNIVPRGAGDAGTPAPVDPTSLAVPFSSGSRLRAHVLESANGARLLLDFNDTTLDAPCQFGKAQDERQRCLPTIAASVVFVDSQCTEAVAVASSGSCPVEKPRFAMRTHWDESDGCRGTPRTTAYGVGQARAVPATAYVKNRFGCVALASSNFDWAWDASVIPAETFVGAESVAVERAGMRVQVLVAEDGATLVQHELVDTARGQHCWFTAIADMEVCAPVDLAFGGTLFADAQCTQRAFLNHSECDAVAGIDFSGGPDDALFELGDEITRLYSSDTASCWPNDGFDGIAYLSGSAIPLTSLPQLRRRAVADGFPTVMVDSTEDGTLLWVNPVLATDVTGTHCSPAADVQGQLRCIGNLPRLPQPPHFFADEACTQALVIHNDGPVPPRGVWMTESGCGGQRVQGTFTMGARIQDEVVYMQQGTSCRRVGNVSELRLYRTGPEEGVEHLPIVVEKTE